MSFLPDMFYFVAFRTVIQFCTLRNVSAKTCFQHKGLNMDESVAVIMHEQHKQNLKLLFPTADLLNTDFCHFIGCCTENIITEILDIY